MLLVRHIRVDRRKELFLLIYQKMSVILSDYTIFSNKERLLAATGELEESIIHAALSDRMNDVVSYVRKWQAGNQQVHDQLMTDVGTIVDQIPVADKIKDVIEKRSRGKDEEDLL